MKPAAEGTAPGARAASRGGARPRRRGAALLRSLCLLALAVAAAVPAPARTPARDASAGRIAYVDFDNGPGEAPSLVVMDVNGSRKLALPLVSAVTGQALQKVDALKWLPQDRLVITAPLDGVATEYLVVDLVANRIAETFVDEGHGAAFSPDGRHRVVLTGASHFGRAGARSPVLRLDGRPIFGGTDIGARVVRRPIWSPDASTLAVPVRADARSGDAAIVAVALWQRGRRAGRVLPLPAAAPPAPHIFWVGNQLWLQVQKTDRRGPGMEGDAPPPQVWRLLGATTARRNTRLQWQEVPWPLSLPPPAAGRSTREGHVSPRPPRH